MEPILSGNTTPRAFNAAALMHIVHERRHLGREGHGHFYRGGASFIV